MSEEINILKLVCQRLEQASVPYMITGSFAINFYAVPRMTRNLDIVIEINRQDGKRLFQVFENDFYIDIDAIIEAVEHQSMFNIIHNESVFKVDFIIRKNSTYRSTEFNKKQRIQLDGHPIWVVGPEDLILSKLIWAKDSLSSTQFGDIRNLIQTIQSLDHQYINDWVEKLKLSTVYEKAKK